VSVIEDEIAISHQRSRRQGVDFPEVDIIDIWRWVLKRIQPAGADPGNVPRRQIQLLAISFECRVNPVWPMPNLIPMLTELSKKGVRSGILSNAQFYTELILTELYERKMTELGFDPDLCFWSYLHGKGKPSLSFFNLLRDLLNEKHAIKPQQTLYVGNDMLKDILPSATIGWRTALFAGDGYSPQTSC